MIQAARCIEVPQPVEGERILICKRAPAEAADQDWIWGGRTARVDSVGTLAEALAVCFDQPVDKLVVNMFSFTSAELTALKFFRAMRPCQHVVIVCTEDAAPMLLESDLADECHTIRLSQNPRNRARRARA